MNNLIARAATSIDSARHNVWDALISPDAIKQYMFGADVKSDWREGSLITWSGDIDVKAYNDTGVVLKVDLERMLQYSHCSMQPGTPGHQHTVTIHLMACGDNTAVSLAQDNIPDDKSREESQQKWTAMLHGLKRYVEQHV